VKGEKMLAFIGFLMIGVIVYLLIQSKATPASAFTIIPIIAAFAAGESFKDIIGYIQWGIGTTWPVAILFMFSVIFFSVLTDAGMFDPLVNWLSKKAGSSIVAITVVTAIIATIAHLDGALAATLLVTVPAMLPLYKKLNIRPVVLLVIIGASMSCMNLLPWGGPVARVAAITNTDINVMWHHLIPIQFTGFIIAVIFAAILGVLEKKRGAGSGGNGEVVAAATEVNPKLVALKRPKLIWYNVAVTALTMGLMMFTKIPLYAAFMIGLALVLVVNYPRVEDQTARVKEHASNALQMAAILIATGIFLGVLTKAKMMDAMATTLLAVIPNFIGPYLHIVMGVFAVPIGMLLGTDSYFFGLLPLAIGVGEKFGITSLNMSYAMLVGKNYGVLTTPHAATTYLAMGLAGVTLKELLYYCMPRLWVLSLIALGVAIVLGIVTI
jgi:CitMHS family citrate-Mg2+:H+ or citrate-Ca2+:H+ symporter